MKQFVFAYGTLRTGGGATLSGDLPNFRSLGFATVKGSLFDLGEYPALLLDESGTQVHGEVFEVDEETLDILDEFESTAAYSRLRTTAYVDGEAVDLWVYCPDRSQCVGSPRINSGDWLEYCREKDLK